MKSAQPPSNTIRQIEFELEKAEHGMALPYDAERVMQMRNMLREARKQTLSAGLRARRRRVSDDDSHHAPHQGDFVVTAPDIGPMRFKSRAEARDWGKTHYPGSPLN